MMRKVLAMALLVSLLAGCSGRPATPPAGTDAPPPASPAPPSTSPAPSAGEAANPAPAASVPAAAPPPVAAERVPAAQPPGPCGSTYSGILKIWGNFEPARGVDAPGGCRFVVDTGPLIIQTHSVAAPTEAAARSALQVTGAAPAWPAEVSRGLDSWFVSLNLQGGQVGDTIELQLRTAPDAAPIPVTLVRKAPPTIAVSIAGADGSWVPLTPGSSLPPGPKRLRFQATGGVNLSFLAHAFYGANWFDQVKPDRITQVSADVAEVAFDNPPPLVMIFLFEGKDPDGLHPAPGMVHFYSGDAPELLVQEKDGRRTRIGQAPPDIWTTTVRADGRYAALQTLIPGQADGFVYWLVDLQTGKLTRTPFTYTELVPPGFDSRGRLVAPLDDGGLGILIPETGETRTLTSAANHWLKVSPDGRYIAGRSGNAPGQGTGGWSGPPKSSLLIIRDLQTDEERVYPWDPQGLADYGTLSWLPDGRLLQQIVQKPQEPWVQPTPENTWHAFLVDLKTGQRTPDEGKHEFGLDTHRPQQTDRPDEDSLAALPDGRTLLLHWANIRHARGLPPP